MAYVDYTKKQYIRAVLKLTSGTIIEVDTEMKNEEDALVLLQSVYKEAEVIALESYC